MGFSQIVLMTIMMMIYSTVLTAIFCESYQLDSSQIVLFFFTHVRHAVTYHVFSTLLAAPGPVDSDEWIIA